mmetsp:Transcript_4258/g.2811  ORF Transcript_4258/g.2811 Transcript_4258/m.2811 type:complete len:134 (+) Transcript_4258:317-718(+)
MIVAIGFLLLLYIQIDSYNILLWWGVQEKVARHAQEFIYGLIPCIFFHTQFDCIRAFLNSTNQSMQVTISIIVMMLVHPIFCYIFVIYFDYAVAGAGIALSMTEFVGLALITFLAKNSSQVPVRTFICSKEIF